MRHLLDVRPAGIRPYPVLLGDDAVGTLVARWEPSWRQAVVLGDSNTAAHLAEPLARGLEAACGTKVLRLSFAAGEAHKTRATKERLEDAMLEARIERSACLVAVGGGVTLDLGGFVAATFQRGIAHVLVATSLLAQVDAAIGGKTGVDTPHGKNLIGAFHHPRAVLLDHGALASLPEAELANGLAEMVKHAALADAAHFADLERWAGAQGPPPTALVARSVAIKAAIVDEDARDEGRRNALNFGHTVGHAIEAATQHRVPHGRAVAIGMRVEARAAREAGWLPREDELRLEGLLHHLGLPLEPPCTFDEARPFLISDKKTSGGAIHCAIPETIGEVRSHDGRWTRPVDVAALERAWTASHRTRSRRT